jgi:MOSC domain-containing protein YiiM
MPCYKLAIKFERPDIIKRFFVSRKPGIYFKVLKEGEVGIGDQIHLIHRDENNVTVQDIMKIYGKEKENQDLVKRALKVSALAEVWKQSYQKILEI